MTFRELHLARNGAPAPRISPRNVKYQIQNLGFARGSYVYRFILFQKGDAMLISEKNRFIFIHVPKNAGTSITSALLPYTMNSIDWFRSRAVKKLHFPEFLDPQPYYHHIKASELVEKIGLDLFQSYFSFAIVRNPWDWQVSFYKFLRRRRQNPHHKIVVNCKSFDEYIEWRCNNALLYQSEFIYSKDGKQLVKYIAKYENLEHEFRVICDMVKVDAKLPRLNETRGLAYQEMYTKKSRELVARAYKKDIELFGYDF